MISLPYQKYKIGHFEIDCEAMTVCLNGNCIKLPIKVFELLKLFIQRETKSVSRELAIERIWDGNEGVGKRGFSHAIWRIRSTFAELDPNDEEVIKTLPKVGYVLVIEPCPCETKASVEAPNSANAQPSRPAIVPLFVVIFGLIAIGVFLTLDDKGATDESAILTSPFSTQKVTNFEGVEEHSSVSNNGDFLAFQWIRENRKGQIYIKNLRDKQASLQLITTEKYEEASPAWSKDDTSLAYIRIAENNTCQVRIRDLETHADELIDEGCYYIRYRQTLAWSPSGNQLLYSKALKDSVALFSYDFNTGSVQQVSYPTASQEDIFGIWSEDEQSIAYVREQYLTAELILTKIGGDSKVLLENATSISGVDWYYQNNEIYISYTRSSNYLTKKYSFKDDAWSLIVEDKYLNNISIDQNNGGFYSSEHISNEILIQYSLDTGEEEARVYSSSRDMYGHHVAELDGILFQSNRDENWDVWLKTADGARNLTNGIGVALTPIPAPDSCRFLVSIKMPSEENFSLFLGTLPEGSLKRVNTQGLVARNPNWSKDGKSIFFMVKENESPGLYKLNVDNESVERILPGDFAFAVESDAGDIYLTKNNQPGIWQFSLRDNRLTPYVADLSQQDFASFFWQNDGLYLLKRTDEFDEVTKYEDDKSPKLIKRFPANSVRKFYGLGATNETSFMVTHYGVNDADIYLYSKEH